MKKKLCFACVSLIGLVLTLLIAPSAQAQLQLVYDVNHTASQQQSAPAQFTAVNGTVLFVATGTEGRELWKTNGTLGGTVLVKDIRPGNLSSDPKILAVVGNYAFFSANDGVHGTELWKSDGTSAGTVLVKDVFPGAESSNPQSGVAHSGLVFFTAQNYDRNYELWRSDGTDAGTAMVQDIQFNNVNPGSSPGNFLSLGTTLLFTATTDSTGMELWKTDATGSGISLVKDIVPGGSSSSFQHAVAMNGVAYFGTFDGTGAGANHGYELWRSDGTAAGTYMVKDVDPGSNSGGPLEIIAVNNTLYLSLSSANSIRELWKSDGTESGTVLLKTIRPGATNSLGSDPFGFKVMGANVYFFANNGTNGVELWKTDGTTGGTAIVKDIYAGSSSGVNGYSPFTPTQLEVIGSNLYFYATSGPAQGFELWKSDGTAGGTALVKELGAGAASASITEMKAIGSLLYFAAAEPGSGFEPYVSDGTFGGTQLLKNIGTGTASSNPASLTPAAGKLYFSANDGVNGREVWVTDGVDTHLTRTTNATTDDFSIAIGALNGTAYFGATTSPTNERQLWRSDGTNSSTYPVSQAAPIGGLPPIPGGITFRPAGNLMFFTAYTSTQGEELWRTDGTAAGTFLLKDTMPGADSSEFGEWVTIGNILYYVGDTQASGKQLFRSDGTVAGTHLVKDFGVFGDPYSLCVFGNTLYFSADADYGNELYKTNGTAAGTVLVKDVNTNGSSFAALTTPLNSTTLLFTAFVADNTGYFSTELWKTNGTAAGTVMVKDIYPGYLKGSYPRALVARPDGAFQFAVMNGVAYFSADDGVHGRELWRSDGTSAGTYLVKDIIPDGTTGSDPASMVVLGNRLYFVVTISGATQLWTSDGTTQGTMMVDDQVTGITNLTVSGTNLYVVGSQSEVGTELFWLPHVIATPFNITQSPGPGSQTVAAGAKVTFTVATSGETPTYQWRRNGVPIAGATKTTYTLTAAENLEGVYDVLMRSGSFELLSGPAQLFVTDPAKIAITQQPLPRLVKTMDAVSFKVGVVGQTPSFQWYKGAVPIPEQTSDTLTILFASPSDAGLYKVKVSNSLGVVFSSAVQLAVVNSADTFLPVKSLTTASMSAQATGTGLTYQWMLNGSPIANGYFSGRLSGATTSRLSIAKFTTGEQYDYSCIVSLGSQTVVSGKVKPRVAAIPIITASGSPPAWIISGAVYQYASSTLFTQSNLGGASWNAPTSYSIVGLPLGMTYDAKTGLITGRPQTGGGTTIQLKIKAGNVAGTITTAITVNIPVNVLPPLVKGAFRGLADRSDTTLNNNLGNYVQADVTATGSLSGKLYRGTTAYPFVTRYVDTTPASQTATAAVTIPRPGTTPLMLLVTIDGGTGAMAGTLSDTVNTVPVTCARSPWIAAGVGANPATVYAKAYTAALQLLPAQVGDLAIPQGDGYAVASITTGGAVSGAVRVADGTKVTFSTLLGAAGQVPLHVAAYTNTGSLHGWSTIASGTGNWDGTPTFGKGVQPITSTTRSYKAGIPLHTLTLVGGTWTKPTTGALLLGASDSGAATAANNAQIVFTRGGMNTSHLADINGQYTVPLRIKAPASTFVLPVAANNPGKLTLAYSTLITGEISGSFITIDPNPLGGAAVSRTAYYYGVIVQRLNRGRGHFNLAKLPDMSQTNALKTEVIGGLMELSAPQ